jgi:hypothetical protein
VTKTRTAAVVLGSLIVLGGFGVAILVPPIRERLDRHAGAIGALTSGALVVFAAVTAWAARASWAQRGEELAGEHAAAVVAVFHELRAVAVPLSYALQHGFIISALSMESYGDVYRQLLVPLYRGLPLHLAERLSKTYVLLRKLRAEQDWNAASLEAIFNDDVRNTLLGLQEHGHDVGLTLDGIPDSVPRDDIVLYHQQPPPRI